MHNSTGPCIDCLIGRELGFHQYAAELEERRVKVIDKLQVTKRLLRLEEVVGEETAQAVVSQKFDVPKPKPPIANIVDFATSVSVTETTVLSNKVVVKGTVGVVIIYEAQVPDQAVHVVRFEIPFSTFVDVPGAAPGMTVVTIPRVEHVSFDVSPDGKQVTIRVVVGIVVRVIRSVQLRIVTGVTGVPGLKVTRELIRAETVLGEDAAQVIVRDVVDVPEKKPPVRAIIDHVATAAITATTIVPNKVIVRGTITVRIIYEAVSPYQTVHVLHATIPFERFVDIEGAMPGMTVIPRVAIEFISFDVSPNGRAITVRAVLEIFAKVTRVEAIEIVTDVSGVPGLKVRRTRIRLQEILGEATRQAIVREVIDIPDEKPPVASILDTTATVAVTRTIVLPGKVIVEGTITQRIVYEAAVPTQTVHVVHATFPFSDFVDIPEAEPGLIARVSVSVEHISVEITPQGDPITVQKVLAITARIFRARELDVVTDVERVKVKDIICRGTVTGRRVNVRTGPSTAFPAFTQVDIGTVVKVLAMENNWLKVKLADGRIGFIFENLVRHDCIPKG